MTEETTKRRKKNILSFEGQSAKPTKEFRISKKKQN